MHVTELRGLRVISLSETLKMGKVEDALLDPTAHFVAALRVRSGGSPGGEHIILREAVKRVGQHAVVLGAPIGMGLQRQPDLDRLIDLQTFLEMEVVTEEGTRLGRIHDAEIDTQTLNITDYEMTRHFWDAYLQTRVRVSARDTFSGSKDVLIVPQAALRKAVAVNEGVDVPKEW
ncbi:MAG TPA: hypothetical protein VKT82_23015 [Ktedonobacterales bacterium]|nr:hypothetical protein [Ktedonobacterales bacterium]